MLSNFIESFEPYIKTYFDSKDTVKECLRYVKNFNQYLNLNNFSDIKQVKYDDLSSFTPFPDKYLIFSNWCIMS